MVKQLFTIEDVTSGENPILPIGKSTCYQYVRDGQIPSIIVGKRKFISRAYLLSIKALAQEA